MGNQPLTIGLQVHSKGPQQAGSIVYGKVYLSVSKKPEIARSIRLRVIGKEILVVHHTSRDEHHHHDGNRRGTTGTHTKERFERSSRDILEMDYPLRVFPDGKIPIGQYEFPFALQLPGNLPSTMSCRKNQSSCEVKFEIVAEVYKHPNTMLHTNPNAKEELVVEAATHVTKDHDTSLSLPEEMVPVAGCCCSKNGTMSLEAKFDKTTAQATTATLSQTSSPFVIPEDAFMVTFRCSNRSTIGVEKVRVQLHETIEWSSNGYQEQVKSVLAKADLDASRLPELQKLSHRKVQRQRRAGYSGVDGADSGILSLQDQPWHTIGPLQVPRHTKDSYQGHSIHVRHVLTVELVTKGCCINNPDASTLVSIYRRLAKESENATHPQDHGASGCSCPSPSAPLEDAPSMSASAPSEFYDQHTPLYLAETTATAIPSAPGVLADAGLVEAQVLPPDWNAQTAEVVTIPMAEAIVLGPNFPQNSQVRPSAPTL